MNVMCLDHPETTAPSPPHQSVKKCFHKTSPWCQKGWDCCSKGHEQHLSVLKSICHLKFKLKIQRISTYMSFNIGVAVFDSW